MGMFLNSITPYEGYKSISETRFFIDKSSMIEEVLSTAVMDDQKFLCFTRPRRFGKSVMAGMVGAFFGKATGEKEIFDGLEIAKSRYYEEYLHRHDVIYIDFSRLPRHCNCYKQFIDRIENGMNKDLAEANPMLDLDINGTVWDNLQTVFEQNHTKFVFVMGEWDAIFHKHFISDIDKKSYLEFLRDLLKGQEYVELAYMTGVLPIAKYSSGSELNMFREYDMATKEKFGEYFGFSDEEVDRLFAVYEQTTANAKITRADLTEWYNGYRTASGIRMYNPRSIICSLTDNQISNYWTSSGPYDEIFYYVRNNIEDVRDDLLLMVAGERIAIKLQGYAATSTELRTKNQIYSAMVVYGLLTYEDGEVFVPNRELMDWFDELLLTNKS